MAKKYQANFSFWKVGQIPHSNNSTSRSQDKVHSTRNRPSKLLNSLKVRKTRKTSKIQLALSLISQTQWSQREVAQTNMHKKVEEGFMKLVEAWSRSSQDQAMCSLWAIKHRGDSTTQTWMTRSCLNWKGNFQTLLQRCKIILSKKGAHHLWGSLLARLSSTQASLRWIRTLRCC